MKRLGRSEARVSARDNDSSSHKDKSVGHDAVLPRRGSGVTGKLSVVCLLQGSLCL